jgi:predicted acylesterase/phospholipase RssA
MQSAVDPDDIPKRPKKRCDLVMKGGVTSGIVYPLAVCELAKRYRFVNIGSTSAGAIAASLTAAAEYRRKRGNTESFTKILKSLLERLGSPDKDGNTFLFSLFQPDRSTKQILVALMAIIYEKRWFRRCAAILRGILFIAPGTSWQRPDWAFCL